MNPDTLPTPMYRRALLVFADSARLDLARRRLPAAALSLLRNFHPGECPGVDVHVFGCTGGSPRFHAQRGRTFGERLENAVETLAALGYEEIVAVGRDCPDLAANDIAHAFAQLSGHRLVLGPDHRGGCYLIAFRSSDRDLLRGVSWQHNTDCAELISRVDGTSVALLATKHDLDSWSDLLFAARANARIARVVAFLVMHVCGFALRLTLFVHEETRFVRVRGQIPPPARVFA